MKVVAVLGGQWGDEGKGKVVDLLANRFDIVARYHGGHNAGHTVKFGDQHFALHLLPAGDRPRPHRRHRARASSWTSRRCSGRDRRRPRGRASTIGENLLLSDRATVILPYHRLLDAARERAAGDAKIGTTLRGIGPAYESVAARQGVRVAELFRPEILAARVEAIAAETGALLRALGEKDVPAADEVLAALRAGRRPARAARHRHGPLPARPPEGRERRCSPRAPTARCSTSPRARTPSSRPRTARRPPSRRASRSRRAPLDASLLVLKAYTTRVGAGPVSDRALRRDRRVSAQARQRVRHLDRPPAPHRLVRRRRRAHGRRALGRRRRRDHQARLPRRARGDPGLRRLPARRQAGLGPAAARRGHRPPRARVRDASRLEGDDDRRHALRGASRRRAALRARPRGGDRRPGRLRLDRPAARGDDLALRVDAAGRASAASLRAARSNLAAQRTRPAPPWRDS